jgi:hypothetical protein
MQSHIGQSPSRITKNIWLHEGLLAFYKASNLFIFLAADRSLVFILTRMKGSLAPLLGVGACVCVHGLLKRFDF